jgi:hypothetical protein
VYRALVKLEGVQERLTLLREDLSSGYVTLKGRDPEADSDGTARNGQDAEATRVLAQIHPMIEAVDAKMNALVTYYENYPTLWHPPKYDQTDILADADNFYFQSEMVYRGLAAAVFPATREPHARYGSEDGVRPQSPSPSCWIYWPQCPNAVMVGSSDGQWYRDAWGEQNLAAAASHQNCMQRQAGVSHWCAGHRVYMHYVPVEESSV